MSISFPHTFLGNSTLNAFDVRSNLDAMQKKQQKMAAADIDTSNRWVDTNHIMEGVYEPLVNITTNVSGIFGGKNNGAFFDNMSYSSRWISNRHGSSNNINVRLPLTTITFDLHRPATLVFQWHMVTQSAEDGDGSNGWTSINAGVNNIAVRGINTQYYAYEQPNGSTHNVLVDGTRTSNGLVMVDVSGEIKNYSIGLVGTSTAGKAQHCSWSVSLECFFL